MDKTTKTKSATNLSILSGNNNKKALKQGLLRSLGAMKYGHICCCSVRKPFKEQSAFSNAECHSTESENFLLNIGM